MSDLQLALLALGALIILLVIAYNWWQERKLHQQTEKHFDAPKQDVLLQQEDGISVQLSHTSTSLKVQEDALLADIPVDTFVADDVFEISADVDVSDDPIHSLQTTDHDFSELDQSIFTDSEPVTLDDSGAAERIEENIAALEKLQHEASRLPESIHSQIDLTALMYLPQPVSVAACFSFLDALKGINKPSYAYGLNMLQIWEKMSRERDVEYTKLACSLQLADRSGCVSRADLNYFQNEIDMLSAKLSAQIEWQGSGDPYVNAVNLDQFCIEVDKTISIHVKHGENGPFTGTKLRGLAEARNLILKDDGAFHAEDENGNTLFILINQENYPFSTKMLSSSVVSNITFQLDIPRVNNMTDVFNNMVSMARQFKDALGGHLVDDLQKELGEIQLDKIRHQLKIIHATMIARNIEPGGATALRLFS